MFCLGMIFFPTFSMRLAVLRFEALFIALLISRCYEIERLNAIHRALIECSTCKRWFPFSRSARCGRILQDLLLRFMNSVLSM